MKMINTDNVRSHVLYVLNEGSSENIILTEQETDWYKKIRVGREADQSLFGIGW